MYRYTSLPVLHSLKHLLALTGSALPPSPHFLQLICQLNKDPSTSPIKLKLATQHSPEQHTLQGKET